MYDMELIRAARYATGGIIRQCAGGGPSVFLRSFAVPGYRVAHLMGVSSCA
jgi:hypothetical protein